MNLRKTWISVIGVGVALVAAACGGTAQPSNNAANETGTLTIWLMNGSAPQSVVDGVNADFKTKYPNVTVNVEIQQWGDIGTKLDTAYAGSTPPDVVELGNTLVAKYAAAGALEDITGKKSSFENSGTWLQSLTDSCTVNGKLYCVPYYAGSRAVIYRKDFFDAAGLTPPTSMDGLLTAGQKLMQAHSSDPQFSALYFPGKYWYAALPFVWDFGGDIATQSGGKWQGALNSSSAQQGLTTLDNIVTKLSRADKSGDEAKQDAAFAQGHIAMIIANGWEVGVITDPKAGNPALADKLGAFPIPSHNSGQTAP
ncbi:MAG TPA: extracellular solute-binding protein, partial [Candidatus Dormibacteraeota bacterium]|nr:extracellular solute-binding protein [Candidatus Dormibacteraeota bacterium]